MGEAFSWTNDDSLSPKANKALKTIERVLASLQTSTSGSEGGSVASLRIPRHQAGNYFYDTVAYNNIPSAQRTALATAVMASHANATSQMSLPDTDGVSIVTKEPSLSDITTLLRLSIAKSADELRLVLNDAAIASLAGYGYSLAGTIAATSGTAVYRGTLGWEPYAILMPHAAYVFTNILDYNLNTNSNVGQQTTANGGTIAYEQVMAEQRHGVVISCPASVTANAEAYFSRGSGTQRDDMQSYFDALFAPSLTNGTSRYKSKLPSFRAEGHVHLEASVTAGQQASGFWGYIGHRVSGDECYGIGFNYAPKTTGNGNWWCAVTDYSGGAVGDHPLLADRIVWVDSGVAIGAYHYLAIETGQNGGTPYISWQVDGTEIYKMSGNFPSYPNSSTSNTCAFGAKTFRASGNSADKAIIHIVGPTILSRKLAA